MQVRVKVERDGDLPCLRLHQDGELPQLDTEQHGDHLRDVRESQEVKLYLLYNPPVLS